MPEAEAKRIQKEDAKRIHDEAEKAESRRIPDEAEAKRFRDEADARLTRYKVMDDQVLTPFFLP